jgi:hypothetical protein
MDGRTLGRSRTMGGVVRQHDRSRKPRGEAPSGKARIRLHHKMKSKAVNAAGNKRGATHYRVAPHKSSSNVFTWTDLGGAVQLFLV